MPSPEYSPVGSASASARTMSTAETWRRSRPRVRRRLASAQREHHAPGDELAVVGLEQRADPGVGERRGHLLDDDPHHLLGRDPVGHGGGDERARAGADVDVELVDGLVDREQVERPQRPDLIDPAGEPTPAEDERGLGSPPPLRTGRLGWRPAARSVASLTTLPMRRRILVARARQEPQLCAARWVTHVQCGPPSPRSPRSWSSRWALPRSPSARGGGGGAGGRRRRRGPRAAPAGATTAVATAGRVAAPGRAPRPAPRAPRRARPTGPWTAASTWGCARRAGSAAPTSST